MFDTIPSAREIEVETARCWDFVDSSSVIELINCVKKPCFGKGAPPLNILLSLLDIIVLNS